MSRSARRRGWTALVAAVAATTSISLHAHDAHVVGSYRIEIGWADEPAFTGIRNAVVVEITEVAGGRPLDDLGGGAVSAEVSFGSERVTLPLERAAGRGHELRAWLLPTRPGTYTFRIVGKIKTQAIDITSTCSAKTFDCVADVTAIQFPSKDPSIGQIADRLDRSLPRAEQASSTAAEARTVAFIAVAIAVFAQVSALVLGFRRARKGS